MATIRESVSLRDRFPEIIRELGANVDDALLQGARVIAAHAADRAPVRTGTLRDSIEAHGAEGNRVEIMAAWYWFLVELGTVNAPAQPFLVPAAEEGREFVEQAVREVLRSL